MIGWDAFLIFAAALTTLTAAGVLVPWLLDIRARRRNADLDHTLAELTKRQQGGDPITKADVEHLMGKLTVAQYAASPEDRLLLVKSILSAAANGHTINDPIQQLQRTVEEMQRSFSAGMGSAEPPHHATAREVAAAEEERALLERHSFPPSRPRPESGSE
jgi:hypothetical protein